MRLIYRLTATTIIALVLVAAGCSSSTSPTTSTTATSTTPPPTSTTTTPPTSTTTTPPPTSSTTTPPTSTTTPPTTSPTTTTSTAATFQSLSNLGAGVYSSTCAVCHGASGQGGVGPALWGSNATLGTYLGSSLYEKNAQAMLTFITAQMPLSAPGSLTSDQYVDVLCYILLQNNYVSGSTAYNQSQLSSITWS